RAWSTGRRASESFSPRMRHLTRPRRCPRRAPEGSARCLPSGDPQAQGEQRQRGHGEQHGDLLAYEFRPGGGGEARHPGERQAGPREDHRHTGQRRREIAPPHRGKRPAGDEGCRDEKDGDEVNGHRERSLTRQAAVAPTRATRTTAPTASVASASCAKSKRPRAALFTTPPKNPTVTKSPRKAA